MAETLTTDEKIKFTTPKEMEKYEAMFDKTYVRVDKDGKPVKDSKEYFYKLVSIHPSQPAGHLGTMDFVMNFSVQKYYRNKVTVTEKDGKKIRNNIPKESVDENGVLVDSDASFFIACSKFCVEFQAE